MASIYDLKPKFQGLHRPLNSKLADKGEALLVPFFCDVFIGNEIVSR